MKKRNRPKTGTSKPRRPPRGRRLREHEERLRIAKLFRDRPDPAQALGNDLLPLFPMPEKPVGKVYWRVHPHFRLYEISSIGDVRDRKTKRFKKGRIVNRYGIDVKQVQLKDLMRSGRRVYCVRNLHMLVLEAFRGKRLGWVAAASRDGSFLNCTVTNLYWKRKPLPPELEANKQRLTGVKAAIKLVCPSCLRPWRAR